MGPWLYNPYILYIRVRTTITITITTIRIPTIILTIVIENSKY